MLRKYIIVNTWTGYVCFGGRRFFTARGAARKIAKAKFAGDLMQIRKFV